MNIDKILDDFRSFLPSSYEMDDLKWRPDETMMQTRIYRVGKQISDEPPFFEIKDISKAVERRLIQYLESNGLEYQFSSDSEYFPSGRVSYPTLRIWEPEEDEFDLDEDISNSSWTKFYNNELERTYYIYKDENGNELGGYYFVDNDGDGYFCAYLKNSRRSKNFRSSEEASDWVEKHVVKKEIPESRKKRNVAGFFSTLYPGDPEKNAEIFNSSTRDCSAKEMSESFGDSNWMYLSDVIEGMSGNVSDDQLDNDLRLFKRISQKLHVRNMDDVVVFIDGDFAYDPDYYTTEVGQKIGPVYKNQDKVNEYELFGAHLIAEHTSNGLFLYFPDSASARKYITSIDEMNENLSVNKELTESNKESANRTNLINKIKSFGKNYDFNKYTDQQLFRIANRLQDAAEIQDVMKEFAEKRKQVQPAREYDPDYDIPDETYVEKLTIRQKLGRLDEECLDNGKYLDLRNLYEAVAPTMTPDEKEELRKVVNATNDPDIISAYLNGKYKEKDESLKEDLEGNLFRALKRTVGEFLEFCEAVEWAFPEGLIFDDWKDWIDDNEMSSSYESVESAEILLDEYRHLYEVNKNLAAHGVDDWETDTFIECYENMKSAYNSAQDEWEKNHPEG